MTETMPTEPNTDNTSHKGPLGWLKRLYDWVLGWADTRYGAPALFILAFAESSFFPIPPDVLLVALAVAAPTRAFRFAAICTAGSVLGGAAGYAIGYWAYDTMGQPIVDAYHGHEVMLQIQAWYDEYGFWGTLLAAITPIPYKIFTIASGVFKLSFPSFMAASLIGRAFRFFLVASIIKKFGPGIKDWIDRRFNLAVTLFTVLLILGVLAIKLL